MHTPIPLIGYTAGLLLLAGCTTGDSAPEEDRLFILAAASLNTALPELIALFGEQESGVEIDLVLGSTGSLAAQVQQGAPADVFLTSDAETIARLVPLGLIAGDRGISFATGRLALVV